MKKTRSNAKWAALTAKQTALLEEWLFEEKLSYGEALARAKKEFGYAGSRSGLQRFYHRLRQERWLKRLTESGGDAGELAAVRVNTGAMLASAMKLLGLQFFEEVRDGAEELKDAPLLARLLMQHEANEIQREENRIREEALELRRRALDFQEKRWQFDVMEAAESALPELQELQKAREDEEDPYAENKRINAIRIRLFGRQYCQELHPENAEEEAAMAKAKSSEEAEREARSQQLQAEAAKPPAPSAKPPEPTNQEVENQPDEAIDQGNREPTIPGSTNGPKAEKTFLTKIKRLEP